jgi:alkanesulfonate monooxygenase SsuD/methylene tetrahydromethanopterin reductase-like flavin-dependent oxidoreductase (luciferase family)
MKVGICLPYMERDYHREDILSWCRRIDQGPFSSLSCGERITGYTLEMRVLLAAAAAVTERVRIVPSLYVLPMHSAVWAAKEIATLDQLSAGRVTVTVGVGGRENDYRAVDASFRQRHQRMDDQIAVMRDTWAGIPPFEGCDEVGPRPVQAGGPPILAGALGPKAIARAARWADGLYGFSMGSEKEQTRHLMDMTCSAWAEAGREEKPYFVGGFWFSLADDAEARLKDYVFNYVRNFGDDIARAMADSMTRFTPAAVTEVMAELDELGVDEIFLVPATCDLREIDEVESLMVKAGWA